MSRMAELEKSSGTTKDIRKVDTTLDSPKFTKEKGKFTGAERGTILHKVMEQLDFPDMADLWSQNHSNETKKKAIEAIVQNLITRHILTEEETAVVAYSKIIGFFDSEIGKRGIFCKRSSSKKSPLIS